MGWYYEETVAAVAAVWQTAAAVGQTAAAVAAESVPMQHALALLAWKKSPTDWKPQRAAWMVKLGDP